MYWEQLQEIIKAYEGDVEIQNTLDMAINTFVNYMDTCVQLESFIATRSAMFLSVGYEDSEKYKESCSNLDRNRRIIHNACISNVCVINRLCAAKSIEPFYTGNLSDTKDPVIRRAVGDFVGDVAKDIFDNRR